MARRPYEDDSPFLQVLLSERDDEIATWNIDLHDNTLAHFDFSRIREATEPKYGTLIPKHSNLKFHNGGYMAKFIYDQDIPPKHERGAR